MIEGMEENNVTVEGKTSPPQKPFFVMATQNPIEYEGTHPLPEAQLDRFILKLKMGYPTADEELTMLMQTDKGHPIDQLKPVISKQDVIHIQAEVQNVYIDKNIQQYIIQLVAKTRNHQAIYLGVSPRGSIALMKTAKALAYLEGRDYVIPEDRKSTRLNSSHVAISYAVFCLKKKIKNK